MGTSGGLATGIGRAGQPVITAHRTAIAQSVGTTVRTGAGIAITADSPVRQVAVSLTARSPATSRIFTIIGGRITTGCSVGHIVHIATSGPVTSIRS